MEFFLFILFIWIIVIQIKLNEISKKLELKSEITKLEKYEEFQQTIETEVIGTAPETEDLIQDNTEPVEDLSALSETINLPDTKSLDFESAFLGNIFNKIGAIALIIGAIIFLKLVSPFIVFTPVMKISLGFLSSIIMLIIGFRIKDEKMKGYKETLLGTAVSVAFISTYCASALFHICSPLCAIITATLILLGVYVIADKQKTVSMIIIALIAGYLNPVLSDANVSSEFLFGYYIFINLLSAIYVYRNPNRDIINFINLSLTFIVLSIILLAETPVNIIYPLLLWLIYLIYDIFRQEKNPSHTDKNNILNWLNFGILTIFSTIIFNDNKAYIGYLLLPVGLIYSGLVAKFVKQNSENYKPYLYSALITLLISTFFLTDGAFRIGLWSLESVTISYIAYKYKLNWLINWSFGFILAAITNILTTENIIYYININDYKPVLNNRTLLFSFPILSSILSYIILKHNENEVLKTQCNIYKFSFISLIYLYLTFEINSFVCHINSEAFNKNFVSEMLISIIGFKYALQTKRLHNSTNFKLFEYASYTIALLSLITILAAGYVYIPLNYFHPLINVRFLAYFTAVITAIFYARWTNLEFFKYLAAILGFILIHIETNDFISSVSFAQNIDYLLTVMWIMYSGSLMLTGIFKNKNYLKNTGIWISLFAICRIFIFDLEDTDMIYKLIAFITLGLILMLVSYFYNKYNQNK